MGLSPSIPSRWPIVAAQHPIKSPFASMEAYAKELGNIAPPDWHYIPSNNAIRDEAIRACIFFDEQNHPSLLIRQTPGHLGNPTSGPLYSLNTNGWINATAHSLADHPPHPYHEEVMISEYDHPFVSTRPELFDIASLRPVTLDSDFGLGPQAGTAVLRFLDLTQPEKRIIWVLRTEGILISEPATFPYLNHLEQPWHNVITTWHLFRVNNLGFRGAETQNINDPSVIFSGNEPFANTSCGVGTNQKGERLLIPLSPYRVQTLLEHGYNIQLMSEGPTATLNLTRFEPENTRHHQRHDSCITTLWPTPTPKSGSHCPKTPRKGAKGNTKNQASGSDPNGHRKREISPNAAHTKGSRVRLKSSRPSDTTA